MDINTFLHIVIGFIGLVCLAIPFSNDIKKINIKHIIYGILFQLVLAFLLLEIPTVNAFNLAASCSTLQVKGVFPLAARAITTSLLHTLFNLTCLQAST